MGSRSTSFEADPQFDQSLTDGPIRTPHRQEMLVKNYDSAPDYATERGESALMKAAANGHWEPWRSFTLPD